MATSGVASGAVHSSTRPLREALYGDLVWTCPHFFRRELQLESGSEVLATLRWERMLSFEAVGESGDGRWILARAGSLRPQVLVRDPATQVVVATFGSTWRGTGTLSFTTGAEYSWKREGFWQPSHFWSSAQKERLIAFESRLAWHSRYEMKVDPDAHRIGELPVLVLLGGYLMSMESAKSAT